MVAGALVACLTHLLGEFGVGHDLVDGGGHVVHELVGIGGRAGTVAQLVDRHQIAGLAVDDDLGNAAGGGGDYGQATGHGF